jgi:hypothetical protein
VVVEVVVFPVLEGVGGGAQLKHFLLHLLSVLATRLRCVSFKGEDPGGSA